MAPGFTIRNVLVSFARYAAPLAGSGVLLVGCGDAGAADPDAADEQAAVPASAGVPSLGGPDSASEGAPAPATSPVVTSVPGEPSEPESTDPAASGSPLAPNPTTQIPPQAATTAPGEVPDPLAPVLPASPPSASAPTEPTLAAPDALPPAEDAAPDELEPTEPPPSDPEPQTPDPPDVPEPASPGVSDGNAPGLIGFASIAGYGRTGTNGGSGGEQVTVTTFQELADAVSDDVPRIVQISGTISSDGAEMLDVGSNKTLIGVGSDATIDGFGLDLNGWTAAEVELFGTDTCDPEYEDQFQPVQNVIVQNLNFRNAADDSINVQCHTHHVWVDHNHFFNAYDGSVDVKRGSDLVTVSWNRFTDTDKTMLLGHSANNGDQDRGTLRATYHHNWFDNTNTRTPRVRFGMAHVFNNYLVSNDYFIGLGIEAHVYAEANYVERSKTLTQTFSESEGYSLTWTDSNHYDPATITRANDSQRVMQDWLDANGAVSAPTEYAYSPDAAADVPDAVQNGAGAGQL